jgi:hypothetical protein
MCVTQLQWLRPHIDMDASHGIISKAFTTVPNVMILSGICLCAVGYLDSMGMQSDNAMRNDRLFKGQVLTEVRKRLARSDRFIDDTTIEALCTLTSFEVRIASRMAPRLILTFIPVARTAQSRCNTASAWSADLGGDEGWRRWIEATGLEHHAGRVTTLYNISSSLLTHG